jgi:hypothetical protein
MSLLDRARHLTDHADATALQGWPLRRRAVLAGASAAVLSLLTIALPVLLVWVASPQSTLPWTTAFRVGADGWLLAHGVHLGVGGATLSLTPWLLTALPLVTAVLAARRVVALLGDDDVRRLGGFGALRADALDAGAGFTGAYALVTVAVALLARSAQVQPSLVGSVLGGLVLSVVAVALAVCAEFRGDIGTVAPELAAAWHDLVPRFVRRAVRPALWGVVCALASGVLLTLGVVVLHLERIGRLYDSLGAGVVGGTVATLAQAALLPNLGMWALAWMAGPGFGVGDGSAITWTTSDPGLLPLVPVLGALPDPGPLPSWLWLAGLVPVAVGAVVGWRSLRAVSRLSTWQIKAETSATACLLCALLLTCAVALAGGAAGAARLGSVGANPWAVGGALLGELLVGAALVVGGSHLRARRG